MYADPWLDRWLPLISQRGISSPVLEIGCGFGDDTVTLIQAGLNVLAFDLSPECVATAQQRAPKAHIECRDTRDPLPDAAINLELIVASLSLHYFPWDETQAIVHRIWNSLRPGALFLCRLNSSEDVNFGAGQGELIEENFYQDQGHHKRFFDQASVDKLFGEQWHRISVQHMTSHKYIKPKAMWELVLEKR
ncbi:MAG: class I SAM-dependent methyltransferase [Alcaligenes sp.]